MEEILAQVLRAINSYRLEADSRDALLQLLTWLIPSETGIDWTERIVNKESKPNSDEPINPFV